MRFKWKEYGSYVYYLGFLSYLLFLATFTLFIWVSPNPAAYANYYENDTSCNFGPSLLPAADPPELTPVQEYSSYITMVLVLVLAFFELVQAIRVG